MKKATVEIELFYFHELNKEAQIKAIEDHRQFLLDTIDSNDYETEEDLDMQYAYYTNEDEPIIESIVLNEYLFYESGELAHTVHYCGSHPRAGVTEFLLNGKGYVVS